MLSTKEKQSFAKRLRTYCFRLLLVVIPLEIMLGFVAMPPSFEAGVWHGNSYRDRLWIHMKEQRYNSLGYRAEEWQKASLNPRVAVLGDSRFYGQYVHVDETFSSVISEETEWEALNFGLPGASIYEANDFIIDDAIAHGVQLAIMCYDINSSLFSVMTRAQGGSRHNIALNLLRSSQSYRWLELGYFFSVQGTVPVMSIEEYEQGLRQAIQTLHSAGVRVVLIVGWTDLADFPQLYSQKRYHLFRERSRMVAKEKNVLVIEMEEIIKGQQSMLIGSEQMHLSIGGHQFFANHLIDILGLESVGED